MRKIKLMLFFLMLLVVLTGCIKIPMGDGQTLKISKDGLTFSDTDGKESTIKMDENNESLNISNDDGEEWEGSYGENVEIPEDFPMKDFPIPDEATLISAQSMSADDEEGSIVIYLYDEDIEELVEMYKEHFNSGGFVDVENILLGNDDGGFVTLSAKKDGDIFLVQVMDGGEDDATVSLMYGIENE